MANGKDLEVMREQVAARAEQRQKPEAPSAPALLTEDTVMQCERENFLGDGKIFQHLNRGKVVFVHKQEKWLVWQGHHWDWDINGRETLALVELVAQEYLRVAGLCARRLDPEKNPDVDANEKASLEKKRDALFSRARRCRGKDRKAVLDFVHTGPETLSIVGDELDADPALIACANGVIDLDAQLHRAGRQDDYITLASPTPWEGFESDAQPFLDFLLSIVSDSIPLRDFLLRFLGMSLFGRQREHVFMVLFGEGGRNGKDTLMGILRDVLGKDLCSDVAPEMFMEQTFVRDSSKPAPDLLRLRGKRIVYASESSKRHAFNAETVKRLTGGNSLSARGLNENNISEWEMSHTVFLLTNELPSAPPGDEAFWTRLYAIELKRRFVNNPDPDNPNERPKDPDLRQKMCRCAPGILAALVKGYGDYKIQGLNPPPEVTAFTASYRANEDIIGQFIADCCITYDNPEEVKRHQVQATELYDLFSWWFRRNISRKPYSPQKFGTEMKKKGFEKVKNSNIFYLGLSIDDAVRAEWEKTKGDTHND